MIRFLAVVLVSLATATSAFAQTAAAPDLVKQVRQAIADKDFVRGEQLIADVRRAQGTTPHVLAAQSWLGRGALG